jgi:hypothetical protein
MAAAARKMQHQSAVEVAAVNPLDSSLLGTPDTKRRLLGFIADLEQTS